MNVKRTNRNNTTHVKSKTYICPGCSTIYNSMTHFRDHIKNPGCQKLLQYFCNICNFIGYNDVSLKRHLYSNPSFQHFYKHKLVVAGLMSDTSKASFASKQLSSYVASYNLKTYSAMSRLGNVQLNLEYHTIETRHSIISNSDKIKQNYDLPFLMCHRCITGIVDNQFLSRFVLNEKYDSYYNNIYIIEDEEVTYNCNFEAY